jgi:hypothetical protein
VSARERLGGHFQRGAKPYRLRHLQVLLIEQQIRAIRAGRIHLFLPRK